MKTILNFACNLRNVLNMEPYRPVSLYDAVENCCELPKTILSVWNERGYETWVGEIACKEDIDVGRIISVSSRLFHYNLDAVDVVNVRDYQRIIIKHFPTLAEFSSWDYLPFFNKLDGRLFSSFPKYGRNRTFTCNFLFYVRNDYRGSVDVNLIWDFVNLRNKYVATGVLTDEEIELLGEIKRYVDSICKNNPRGRK